MFRIEPEVIGYDLHPEYLATKFALSLPQPERVAVQHHHAHIAALLVESGREEAAIGVSMDGLGYGHDGRLWGGEVLVCDLLGYRRVAHLEELPLAGGAAAIGKPWRTALGWSYALLGEEGLERAARLLRGRAAGPVLSDEDFAVVRRQIDAGVNAPLTTSCGRLFDAVAALAGVRHEITYEGQAAIELEMWSEAGGEPYRYALEGDVEAAARAPLRGAGEWVAAHAADVARGREAGAGEPAPAVVRLAPLFLDVLDDLEAGAARRRRRRPPPRDGGGGRARRLPPGPRGDRPRDGRLGRRGLPEPAAGRRVRRRVGRRRLRRPRRGSGAGERRRRGSGAGRGGGLYFFETPRRAHLAPPDEQDTHMCLALPMRIVAVDGALATIASQGLEQHASLMLVPEARVGDYVLVHAGFAISVLDQADADETLQLLRDIGAFEPDAGVEPDDQR